LLPANHSDNYILGAGADIPIARRRADLQLVRVSDLRHRPVWGITITNLLTIVLANVLGMAVGFMLGGAIVSHEDPGAGQQRPRSRKPGGVPVRRSAALRMHAL